MPKGVDEATWNKAKAQAQKQGQGTNYAYIMSIYKSMEKGDSRKKTMRAEGIGVKDELKTGSKIEAEHKDTVDFIDKYVKSHGKTPPEKEVYRHIAGNHLKGSDGEKGITDYYTRLLEMEKQAKVKRPKIEIEVMRFLVDNPNPPDEKVHALAEKLGIDPHKLEKVFYKLATEQAQMGSKKLMTKAVTLKRGVRVNEYYLRQRENG